MAYLPGTRGRPGKSKRTYTRIPPHTRWQVAGSRYLTSTTTILKSSTTTTTTITISWALKPAEACRWWWWLWLLVLVVVVVVVGIYCIRCCMLKRHWKTNQVYTIPGIRKHLHHHHQLTSSNSSIRSLLLVMRGQWWWLLLPVVVAVAMAIYMSLFFLPNSTYS